MDFHKSKEQSAYDVEYYRRVLENIPAEIGVFDAEGRFVFDTPTGIKDPSVREWVIGKTHHDYARKRNLPESFADERQKHIDRCVRENKTIEFEELIIDPSGNPRHYMRCFCPVEDESGKVTHVIGYGHEITDLKKTEEALRTALAEVEQLKNRLEAENIYLQEEIRLEHNFGDIICRSKLFKKVLRQVEQVAATDSTVLVLGESGTGKELLARAVHDISPRRNRPLVKVNCAALPATLIESELFGHEKGAFTGALSRRIGRFELADGGTIFLDEIGDLSLELQANLLRVLQDGEFERVGGTHTIKVDVRIIAATNRDLEQAVGEGEFREDLFYRLNVFPIKSPPLRDRKEDIPLLVKHFIKKHGAKIATRIETVPKKAMDALQAYHWPGNVRELENIVERALVVSRGKTFELGEWFSKASGPPKPSGIVTLEEGERQHIKDALDLTGWRVSGEKGAAKLLGINPKTLESRMRKLNIERAR
ncbi:MAG: sigma 54-interacting transcriptional regulator [Candidatus Krumholzibacteria bacterium]